MSETDEQIAQKVRKFYRDRYDYTETMLPCAHCIFTDEPDSESGYV